MGKAQKTDHEGTEQRPQVSAAATHGDWAECQLGAQRSSRPLPVHGAPLPAVVNTFGAGVAGGQRVQRVKVTGAGKVHRELVAAFCQQAGAYLSTLRTSTAMPAWNPSPDGQRGSDHSAAGLWGSQRPSELTQVGPPTLAAPGLLLAEMRIWDVHTC